VFATLTSGCDASAQSDDASMLDPEPIPVLDLCPSPPSGVFEGGRFLGREDAVATPIRKLVLMGGSREVDPASLEFVAAAEGGDVLILRASGSVTSYPDYFLDDLLPDPAPASVVTVKTDPPSAGSSASVACRVTRADAIWLAGGNQWHYLGGWPKALHDSLRSATARAIPMGGTSAGAMALGAWAFDARNGTVTSATALADPTNSAVSISPSGFPQPELQGMLVDTHFMERDREGRLLAFLARARETSVQLVGVGIDERTAIVIEDNQFRVLSTGGSVWLYQLTGAIIAEGGQPLSVETVVRLRLPDGAEGAWPPSGVGLTDTLRVAAGVIQEKQ
jgi:cyanophycinase-like exopeptidase